MSQWLKEYQQIIVNPENLRKIAKDEYQKYKSKLTYAPYQDIYGVPYQPSNLNI